MSRLHQWGRDARRPIASTKINRRDFGLVWNKSPDGGGPDCGRVKIQLEVELVNQAPAAKSTTE